MNLERSLPADGRNSGHFVQGHVDDTGCIAEKWVEGDSLWVKVASPPHILRHIVPKGYIAVDGTSLTVCEVNREGGWFTFMLIAYTQSHVIIPTKAVGAKVNLEVDVVGKYVGAALEGVAQSVEMLSRTMTEQFAALMGRMEGLERRLAAVEGRGGPSTLP